MLTIFYRQPRLLLLSVLTITVVGLAAAMVLPRMEDPLLTPRAATLTTLFPGATAERVEALVTEKLEDELREIREIKEVRSSSRANVSFLAVELRDQVTALDAPAIWSRIRDKTDDAWRKMPPEVAKPEFNQLDIKAYALLVGLQWKGETPPSYGILRRLAKQLKTRLEAVPGTEEVDTFGDPGEEITVTIRPEAAASMNLSASGISRQIFASDAKVAAGQLRNATSDLVLSVSGELDSMTRLSAIPIQPGAGGNPVSLAEIATIERTHPEPPDSQAIVGGLPSIVIGVFVRPEQRLDQWAHAAGEVLESFGSELPGSIGMDTIFSQQPFIASRINSLLVNLVSGGAIVFLVVLVMMGWRSALMIGTALPLSCLMTLGVMHGLGIPIHQMSVTGLIISLGMLIDTAIIAVDELSRKRDQGKSRETALAETIRFIAVPLFCSTLTTVLSFSPIALMPGPSGEFVGSIAVVVIVAVTSSLLLSLTVVPAAAALFLTPRKNDSSWFSNGLVLPRTSNVWYATLRILLSFPRTTVVASVAVSLAGFAGLLVLEEQFFPPADRNQFPIELEMPATASIGETGRMAEQIRQELLADPAIERVDWFLGASAPSFYYNIIPDRSNSPRYGQAIVQCRSDVDFRRLMQDLQERLDRKFPEASCLVRQLEQGPPFAAPIEFRLTGPDPEVLRQLGEQIRLVLSRTPKVIQTRAELSEALPKITFKVDEQQARLAGLDHATIAMGLNSALEGTTGGSILEGTEEVPVRVRLEGQNRSDLNRIASLDLIQPFSSGLTAMAGPGQQPTRYNGIPLGSLASLQLDCDVSGITRLNGQRLNEVQAFLVAGTIPAGVQADAEQRLKASGFQLPPGYQLGFGGAEAERDDAVGNLMVHVALISTLMICTLVISLRSFRHAGIILLTGGLSMGAGIGALWIFDCPMGFMGIVGMMGMIGVAINDSIMVLAAIQEDPRARGGDLDAMCRLVVRNTRHILATTITTIAGFLPLLASGGEFWPPVVLAISGGVGWATILAVLFVPGMMLALGRQPAAGPTEEHYINDFLEAQPREPGSVLSPLSLSNSTNPT